MDISAILNRKGNLFDRDLSVNSSALKKIVEGSSFLVIGSAGTIGQAVTKQIFKRNPAKLHVVDISENNMTELVRDIRSSFGYISGEFRTFTIDCGSPEFSLYYDTFGPYDFVFNLSAMKHVRSERDQFTLLRMIRTNILNTISTAELAKKNSAKNYFSVSTDKAANPVNLMGASKKIMELFLWNMSRELNVTMARFANVAFSDGSLLHGFQNRLLKRQPISAPKDVARYFITADEAGELCLLSGLLGENGETFFPKNASALRLTKFSEITERFLSTYGLKAHICGSEEEARNSVEGCFNRGSWPCYFFESDTTGEKMFEEFFTAEEVIDLARYNSVGVIKGRELHKERELDQFLLKVNSLGLANAWSKQDIVNLFFEILPELDYTDLNKYLDDKM